MATYTTRFNLTKPATTETADIAVINTNMDTIDGVIPAVIDNLTSTSTTSALSANQGKVLGELVSTLSSDVTNLETTVGTLGAKSYGNAYYADSISASATLTKLIAIGEGKRFGQLILRYNEFGTVRGSVMILFSSDSTKALAVGYGTDAGVASSRRHLGSVTGSSGGRVGVGACGTAPVIVQEVYIDGTNLRIDFKNTAVGAEGLYCQLDWEVW